MDDIIQAVNAKGFCCSTDFKEVIPGLEMIKLPLYVDVSFEGGIDANPFRPKIVSDHLCGVYRANGIGEINEFMNDWVRILKYEYTSVKVTGKEEIHGKWQYLDYENLYTTMKFAVYVYYRKISIEEGKKYYVINENGHLVKLRLKWVEDDQAPGAVEKFFSQRAWVPYDDVIYTDQQLEEQNNILIVECF